MSLINVLDVTFGYEGSYDNVFEHVSFQMDTNWKLGLTGRNGRGKTTFLKLLMKEYEYQGTISANVDFEYFPFEIKDKTKNTIDVVEDIDPAYEFWMLLREMSYLDVPEEVLFRPFETLSYGEQTKVLLAALFLKENAFLLIDEPTNHLDMEGRKCVMEYLSKKKGFILVSHDRMFLDGCVDHILAINRTNIDIQKGNFSSWYENKQRQDQFEQAENLKIQKELKHLKAAAGRTAAWADRSERSKIGSDPIKQDHWSGKRAYIGEKTRKMQARRKDMEKKQNRAMEQKSKLLKNIEEAETLKLHPKRHFKQQILRLSDVQICYDEEAIFEPVTLEVNQGERIALRGKNGCGKSSLLKLIYGEKISYKGEFYKANQLDISYVSQDTSMLCGNLKDFAYENGIDETLLKAILRKLDFSREQFDKKMENFSGGQKKKVLIAASLCRQAHLYLWDEPLNFIDVFSRMQIEDLLKKFQPTIIFVEHDRAFSEAVATRTVDVHRLNEKTI